MCINKARHEDTRAAIVNNHFRILQQRPCPWRARNDSAIDDNKRVIPEHAHVPIRRDYPACLKDETGCVAARSACRARQCSIPISTADSSMHQKLIQITLNMNVFIEAKGC